MKKQIQLLVTVTLTVIGIALSPQAQAVVPPPDGGYANFTTAEGTKALQSLTTGAANTAVGWYSLFSNAAGSFNTATGAGALLFNTADENTAVGTAALLFNTIGSTNTAVGAAALSNNTEGSSNTAVGDRALASNTTGLSNSAFGWGALLSNEAGTNNTAVGVRAGQDITGTHNICIGSQVFGVAGENNTIRIGDNLGQFMGESACYIGGIYNQVVGSGLSILIGPDQKLGTTPSSQRFKEDIKSMDNESEGLFALKPVIFRYKKEIDPASMPQFGLIAEDVEKVNPDLVVRDKKGKPYGVRYEQVNAMLLNEFLKEHRKNEEQEATIAQQRKDFDAALAQQQKQIDALTAGLQKVSAQLGTSSSAFASVNNNQ